MADIKYSESGSEFNSDASNDETEQACSTTENGTGALPYQFEHRTVRDYSQYSSSDEDEPQTQSVPRVDNTERCSCTRCAIMQTDRECLCCIESEKTKGVMADYSSKFSAELGCITEHPGFDTICLDRWVLQVAYQQYRQQYGEVPAMNDRCRYIAYRQYVRWCWGFLGKNVSVVLPACVVKKIWTQF